jgi:hypothetical protein
MLTTIIALDETADQLAARAETDRLLTRDTRQADALGASARAAHGITRHMMMQLLETGDPEAIEAALRDDLGEEEDDG